MSFIKEKVQVTCDQLKLIANKKIGVLENIEYVEAIGYKTDDTFPTDGWKPFPKGTFLNGRDAHFWLRTASTFSGNKNNFLYQHQTGILANSARIEYPIHPAFVIG